MPDGASTAGFRFLPSGVYRMDGLGSHFFYRGKLRGRPAVKQRQARLVPDLIGSDAALIARRHCLDKIAAISEIVRRGADPGIGIRPLGSRPLGCHP